MILDGCILIVAMYSLIIFRKDVLHNSLEKNLIKNYFI
jgi:hypothetical protein